MASLSRNPRRPVGAVAGTTLALVLALVAGMLGAGPATAAARRATGVSGWSTAHLVTEVGSPLRLQVRLSGRARAGRTVVVQRLAAGDGSWKRLTASRSDRRGGATLRVPAAAPFDGRLRVVVPATRRGRGLVTAPRALTVQQTGAAGTAAYGEQEREVLQLVNEARAVARTCGGDSFPAVGALRLEPRLSNASEAHARDMAEHGYFSHTSQDGRTPWDRSRAAGYDSAGGENIAAGYTTPRSVVDGWLASDGHCRNIMAAGMVDLGVGYVDLPGSPYRHYWVQLFGRG